MNKILDFVKDKWPIMIAYNVVISLLFFAYACTPKTESLIEPDKKVTLEQLQSEVDILIFRSEARLADLQKQYELRDFILNQSLTIAQTGEVNPIGLITSIIAIMGIGAGADDIRLRKQRKKTLTYEPVNDKT